MNNTFLLYKISNTIDKSYLDPFLFPLPSSFFIGNHFISHAFLCGCVYVLSYVCGLFLKHINNICIILQPASFVMTYIDVPVHLDILLRVHIDLPHSFNLHIIFQNMDVL